MIGKTKIRSFLRIPCWLEYSTDIVKNFYGFFLGLVESYKTKDILNMHIRIQRKEETLKGVMKFGSAIDIFFL